MNETEEKASCTFANIKTRDLGENVEVLICEQIQGGFEYKFSINGDKVTKTDRYASTENDFMIASCNRVEFRKVDYDSERFWFFMKGSDDIDRPVVDCVIPKEEWFYLKQALEILGADIDKEEEVAIEEVIVTKSYSFNATPTEEEIAEMIKLVDLDTFCKIIKNRISKELSSSSRDKLGLINRKWARNYLRGWAISKYKMYKLLGDKLTIEKTIKVTGDANTFRDLKEELKKAFPLYKKIINDINVSDFVDKKIRKGNMPDFYFDDTRVKAGMSVTKFISLFGNNELDIEVSKMYQDIGRNTIYISINPIDYLTVSINSSGWESCHHFLNGCYKNAGLSYMNDRTSLVAYASRKEVNYPFEFSYKWNTKNWRQMIYLAENTSTTVFSRQYPYESDEVAREVRQMFEELMCKFFDTENKWKVYAHESSAEISVEKDKYALLYNDVYEGFNHKVIKAKDDEQYNGFQEILIGAKVYSLLDEERYIEGSENHLITNYDPEYDDEDDYDDEDY